MRLRSFLKNLHKKLLRDTLGCTQHANLIRYISPLLPDHPLAVLDIGCGNGVFSHGLKRAKPTLHITGIETMPHPKCLIECGVYDGITLPFADKSFDYVLLINMLHHADDPFQVLSEASRVSRQGIILKDHYANNRLDFLTLVVMEWIGNAFSNISQPYCFLSEKKWNLLFHRLDLKPETLLKRFVSYNRFFDIFFGRNLHFIAKLTPQYSSLSGDIPMVQEQMRNA